MKYFVTYLSTAPVLLLVSVSFMAGLLIEINRFFPDSLIFSFLFLLHRLQDHLIITITF